MQPWRVTECCSHCCEGVRLGDVVVLPVLSVQCTFNIDYDEEVNLTEIKLRSSLGVDHIQT